MSVASRIEAIEEHLEEDYQGLENIGADLTNVDKNIQNISNVLADLYDEMPKVTGTGTELTLNNTRKGKMVLDLKGNTYQDSTTLPSEYQQVEYIESSGTQYIDTGVKLGYNNGFDVKFLTNSAISQTSGEYGCIFGGRTAGGVADYQLSTYAGKTDGLMRWGNGGPNAKNPKITLNTILQCSLKNQSFVACNGTISTITDTTNTSERNAYIFGLNNGGIFAQSGSGCRVYYLKFYDGNTLIRDFIPCYRISDNEIGLYDLVNDVFYTNQGTGTFTKGNNVTLPTPDYPQDIHTCSGDNTIQVEGKNKYSGIIEYDNYVLAGNGAINSASNFCVSSLIDISSSSNWYLSFVFGTGSDNIMRIGFYDKSETFISRATTTSNTQLTIPENAKYLRLSYLKSGFSNIQLEQNTEATEYESYQSATYPINLGSLELCKIGTYQDYIYKDNGKWYLHKEIGKETLNGTQTINYYGAYVSHNLFYYEGIKNDIVLNKQAEIITITNQYVSIGNSGASTMANYQCRVRANDGRFYWNDDRYTTTTDMNTWFSANNLDIYYILATSTDTEITDENLISQLEAIKKSYDEQTNISQTNNDMPFVISASALKSWSSE